MQSVLIGEATQVITTDAARPTTTKAEGDIRPDVRTGTKDAPKNRDATKEVVIYRDNSGPSKTTDLTSARPTKARRKSRGLLAVCALGSRKTTSQLIKSSLNKPD